MNQIDVLYLNVGRIEGLAESFRITQQPLTEYLQKIADELKTIKLDQSNIALGPAVPKQGIASSQSVAQTPTQTTKAVPNTDPIILNHPGKKKYTIKNPAYWENLRKYGRKGMKKRKLIATNPSSETEVKVEPKFSNIDPLAAEMRVVGYKPEDPNSASLTNKHTKAYCQNPSCRMGKINHEKRLMYKRFDDDLHESQYFCTRICANEYDRAEKEEL